MKKLVLFCAFVIASKVSFGQAHTDSALSMMTKMELSNIYLEEVSKIGFGVPYTPFTMVVTDTNETELDIPTSKYIKKKREDVLSMSKSFGETMKQQLYEIIPYSDKKDIIRAILFLQEINTIINKK